MSRQESMFYPPEQSEQEWQEEARMNGEKIQPLGRRGRPLQRRQFAWLWVVLTVVLLFILGLGVRTVGEHIEKTTVEPTLSYTVPATPHLVLHTQGGDVHIHGGSGDTITIKATRHSGLFDTDNSNTDISASQNGDTVNVTTQVDNHFSLFSGGRSFVSLDITVPDNSDIQLDSAAGNVTIEDVNGQAALHTDAGNITVTGADLSGTSSVISDAGNITFDGMLDAQGNYTFNTKAGDITMTLPGDDAVNLHPQSIIGNINNEFGNPPASSSQAPVNISTGAGNITIHKK